MRHSSLYRPSCAEFRAGKKRRAISGISFAEKVHNKIRLIKRVSNRRQGLGEDSVVLYSFVLCHFSYVAAMHGWQKSERDKLNALLRKTIKVAFGLPMYTVTERIVQLGIHNTVKEIAEAQERAQFIRFATTQSGRHILKRIGTAIKAIDDNNTLKEIAEVQERAQFIRFAMTQSGKHILKRIWYTN